jgi:hypothetical protein
MAVGDFVTGLDITSFQPAATITICITSCAWWDGYVEITDGVDDGYINGQFNSGASTGVNTKIFIDNTNYLSFFNGAAVRKSNYSGIQVA